MILAGGIYDHVYDFVLPDYFLITFFIVVLGGDESCETRGWNTMSRGKVRRA